jgi:hypothetical protein
MNRRVLVGCEMSGEVAHAFAKLGWEAVSADVLPGEKPDTDYRDFRSALYDDDPWAGGRHGSARHYQGDVRDLFSWSHPVNVRRLDEMQSSLRPDDHPLWDLAVLHPPCDHLSQAGAVWWKHKDATRGGDGRMQEGAAFFMEMVAAPAPLVAVENPVGIMGNAPRKGQEPHPCFYRRPDQVVEPWWFGDPVAKKTCLWLKGLPLLTADRPVTPTGRVATGGGSWRTDQRSGRGANNGHEDSRGRKFRKIERSRTLPGFARAMAEQWTAFAEEQEMAA